jgi:hypothetical protein
MIPHDRPGPRKLKSHSAMSPKSRRMENLRGRTARSRIGEITHFLTRLREHALN